ncbi:DNA primase DnaG [Halobacteriales archaeon Cl-PHB]
MQDSAKYLIHATFRATGVVERSDVVGAIFGQTEGLLGDELDLRTLQDSSKVGRIDVNLDSTEGAVSGSVTIASGLDRVETAVLAASLETIDRIGPCRAEFAVADLEDVRSAKRETIVERAEDLLTEFAASATESRELVEEVRERVRIADLTEYEGLPAGPRVADSDAIVVVEGRADVRTLLRYGVKNAVAVEGTDVPEAVADLTGERTVTAFLDGDRGGELILRELAQVGDVDYVAFAPPGSGVEDLDRGDVLTALREKVPFTDTVDASSVVDAVRSTTARPESGPAPGTGSDAVVGGAADTAGDGVDAADPTGDGGSATDQAGTGGGAELADPGPETLGDHVASVVSEGQGTVRLLDADFRTVAEAPAEDAFETLRSAAETPAAVVLDGTLTQRLLDVAAQRGVGQVVAATTGEFVKRPTDVRVRSADSF